MANIPTSTSGLIDRLEHQLELVASHLAVGDANNLQIASESLQSLAVEFSQLLQAAPARGADRRALRNRVRAMFSALQILRDNLSRRAAFTTSSLKILLPETAKSTYLDGKSVYAGAKLKSASYGSLAI